MATKKLLSLETHLHFLNKRVTEDYSPRQYASGLCFLEGFSSQLRVVCLSITYPLCLQTADKRRELPENGRVDSEPLKLPKNGELHSDAAGLRSESSEMGDESKGETRNSVFRSVSMEIASSLKVGDSKFSHGREDNIDYTFACIQSSALDGDSEKKEGEDIFDYHGVSKERNLGFSKSSDKILDIRHVAENDISDKALMIDSENRVSNVFDSLPEPEVQVLWEDYSIPSDSESEPGNSTVGSPKTNHQVDVSSKEIKADVNVGGDKQLEIPNNLAQKEEESVNSSEKSTETNWQEKLSVLNFDYQYELNYLPDHQDIIQQLEVELKNARTGGLPTIFEEETETTEAIDEMCKYEERMGEIQKAYIAYAEKMWKLDILNNQSMHAIGLLQLKYPVQSISVQKAFVPSSKSPLPQDPRLWSGKARRLTADPRLDFIGDLRRDTELVYVGQVCLSWEILQWQLRKALELQQHDSQGIRQYSQVASEFQLFQVLVTRFMEDESFHGHRVKNYVQNRCVFRSLLQVPAIKDDGVAEAKGRKWEDENGFSSKVLTEIVEKSMWVFYEFLLADKDDGKNIMKSNRKYQIELQNTGNSQLLLVNIQAHLQKAERKLKELLRSSNNRSVQELKKLEEGGVSYALILLIAQVDLKLISRVLRMSKLTVDQLLWCNKKLHQITFVNRKVHLEPSLLLFSF